ncbi:hypothetical protein [Streptomyces sp. NPDC002088]|uniref:hypothetical protein n=1 Tax=Streptomyces sp. NPDC002088 TaxID=3154665 RepID=UPI0033295A43
MATAVTRYFLNADGESFALDANQQAMRSYIADWVIWGRSLAVYTWTCIELEADVTVVAFYSCWDREEDGIRAGETITDIFVRVVDLCTCCEHDYDYAANE